VSTVTFSLASGYENRRRSYCKRTLTYNTRLVLRRACRLSSSPLATTSTTALLRGFWTSLTFCRARTHHHRFSLPVMGKTKAPSPLSWPSTHQALEICISLTPLFRILCNAYASLGARGVSILFASGDGGVSGSQSESCSTFRPTFPSGCPLSVFLSIWAPHLRHSDLLSVNIALLQWGQHRTSTRRPLPPSRLGVSRTTFPRRHTKPPPKQPTSIALPVTTRESSMRPAGAFPMSLLRAPIV
jgi:hypothetical protein